MNAESRVHRFSWEEGRPDGGDVVNCKSASYFSPITILERLKCKSASHLSLSDKKVAFDRNCTALLHLMSQFWGVWAKWPALLHFATHLSLLSSESVGKVRRYAVFLCFFLPVDSIPAPSWHSKKDSDIINKICAHWNLGNLMQMET